MQICVKRSTINQILLDRFDANKLIVRILEHNWNSSSESKTQDFQVEKTIKHSGYSTVNYNNDIALLKLKTTIKFQGLMRPACLPEQGTFSVFVFIYINIADLKKNLKSNFIC